jgi:hypothetical protein
MPTEPIGGSRVYRPSVVGNSGRAAVSARPFPPAARAGADVAGAPASRGACPVPPATDALLSLQEAAYETPRDRLARQHGRRVLDALSDLQRALLSDVRGAPPDMDALASLVRAAPAVDDPALAAVMAAIRLRARIELLRHGGSQNPSATIR